jgi:hypothetical protein
MDKYNKNKKYKKTIIVIVTEVPRRSYWPFEEKVQAISSHIPASCIVQWYCSTLSCFQAINITLIIISTSYY